MRNNRLLPYETIVQATSGRAGSGGTLYCSITAAAYQLCRPCEWTGQHQDTEDYITQTLTRQLFSSSGFGEISPTSHTN